MNKFIGQLICQDKETAEILFKNEFGESVLFIPKDKLPEGINLYDFIVMEIDETVEFKKYKESEEEIELNKTLAAKLLQYSEDFSI